MNVNQATMKAAVILRPGTIVYQDVPRPSPGAGEALIAVKSAGICGSELPKALEDHSYFYPIILGHEFAGEVVEVGALVDPDLVGKHVTAIPLLPCGKCDACQKGQYFWCDTYGFVGAKQNGGFAEFVALPSENLFPIPQDMSWDHAALLEPTTVGLHVADRAPIHTGDSVVVIGAGSIGLLALQWLKVRGCGPVYVVDVLERKCQLALDLGADVAINALDEDPVAQIRKLMGGKGAAVVFETSGAPVAFVQALQVVATRGHLVQVGFMAHDPTIPRKVFDLIARKEITVQGSSMSYSAPFPGYEWPTALESIGTGRIRLDPLITHRFSLEDAAAAFEMMASGQEFYEKIILIP